MPSGVEGAYGSRSFDPNCPAPMQRASRGAYSPLPWPDRIEAVDCDFTEFGRVPKNSGRFAFRMSVSSTDHVVVPENNEGDNTESVIEVVETVESVESGESVESAPEVTFATLGLPEGVVRKLAQNGVTTPFPIQAATIPDALVSRTSSAAAAPAPARPSPSVCRCWPSWPVATPTRRSPAASSSRRPVSSRCRSRTPSSRTATSSA